MRKAWVEVFDVGLQVFQEFLVLVSSFWGCSFQGLGVTGMVF